MVLKLVGNPISTCTRRVALVCKEKGIPYEMIPINMPGGQHKSAEFLSKQPFGQVPYIDDDGFIVYESRAIGRYLAAKYPTQGAALIPDASDIQAIGLFEQAASIEYSNFDPFASGLAAEKAFNPGKGIPTDEARVQTLEKALESKLDGYEVILSKQDYLAGAHVTLADLYHLPYGTFITAKLGYDYLASPKRPNVARWWKSISSRDSWLAVVNGA